MCQLLGMNANTPTDVTFSFTGFAQRAGHTGDHCDGWGIAFFEDKGVRHFVDHQRALDSPVADLIRRYPIKSCNVISHIRKATQGAVSLHRFVQGATLTIGRDRRQFIELDKKSALIAVDSYDNTPRQRVGYNEALRNTFRDERVAFTAQQVRAETARCLGCGASIVDPNKCIGCGVCTTKCAFDAIHLHREHPECSTMYACEDKMKAILPYMIKRNIKIKKAERRAKKAAK